MLSTINRKRYPELDRLLWDVHSKQISLELAFRVYEERWGFVQEQNLKPREQALIKVLTRRIGKGIFAPLFGVVRYG